MVEFAQSDWGPCSPCLKACVIVNPVNQYSSPYYHEQELFAHISIMPYMSCPYYPYSSTTPMCGYRWAKHRLKNKTIYRTQCIDICLVSQMVRQYPYRGLTWAVLQWRKGWNRILFEFYSPLDLPEESGSESLAGEIFDLQTQYGFPGLVSECKGLIKTYGLPDIINGQLSLRGRSQFNLT